MYQTHIKIIIIVIKYILNKIQTFSSDIQWKVNN